MLRFPTKTAGLAVYCLTLIGCAAPRFDVAYNNYGPTSHVIEQRIKCELVDLLKSPEGGVEKGMKTLLIGGNYVASMKLEIKATDTGELAPSLKFPMAGPHLSIGGGFKVSKARAQSVFKYFAFSMRDLNNRLNDPVAVEFGKCPQGVRTNLEGHLGIREMVNWEITSPSSTNVEGANNDKGDFGGTVEFTVTRNINSAGPTWTFPDFEGPGGLAKLDRTTVNTLTIAFVPGEPFADQRELPTNADFKTARDILENQVQSDSNNR